MIRFDPPSIKWRGQLARTMAAVHEQQPKAGEAAGTVRCQGCGGTVRFTIDARGNSTGRCASACGVRWPL